MSTVVRAGDTVRRKATPATATTQRLLAHVRSRGVDWVPEPLGLDEQGREVLSFIPGDVPHAMPEWIWDDAVLLDVGRALRKWHDATVDFDRAEAAWNHSVPGAPEVVCHVDFAPYNCVFRDGHFVGLFDFDLCAPGPRLWDLAYTAYRFVPLMPEREAGAATGASDCSPFSLAETWARADAFLEAYASAGPPLRYERGALVSATIERLHAIADWTEDYARTSGIVALEPHPALYRGHARWLSELGR